MVNCYYVKAFKYENMTDVEILAYGKDMLIQGFQTPVKQMTLDIRFLQTKTMMDVDVVSILEQDGEQVELSITCQGNLTKLRTGYSTEAVEVYLDSALTFYDEYHNVINKGILTRFKRNTDIKTTKNVNITQTIIVIKRNLLNLQDLEATLVK